MIEKITLVEKHNIYPNDSRFDAIDKASFAAKNLYNKANYIVRQSFIHEGKYIPFNSLYHIIKTEPEFKAFPGRIANRIIKQLSQNWISFFEAMKVWRKSPDLFLGKPGLPKYKDKQNGRFLLQYDGGQALSKIALKKGLVRPSGLAIDIYTKQTDIAQCRIVPKDGYYVVEIVYRVDPEPKETLNYNIYASIDPGIDNLITLTSNKNGFQPIIVNGRVLKSINQFYNKRKAKLQSQLHGNRKTSKRIKRLTHKRNNKINDYLHKVSRFVVNHLLENDIGILVIGHNKGWKNGVNIGKQNNQKFTQIPFSKLWQMITYKCALVGIAVIIQEESYTSKCSFLDLEPITKQTKYLGKRIARGLFITSDGRKINADVNGSYNILRKAFPNAFANGIEAVAVQPVRISVRLS